MAVLVEKEIMWGRRAFPTAQQLLGATGVPAQRLPGRVSVGWHGTEVDPETGSFAVVADDSDYGDLIGDVLSVTSGRRTVFVYVLGSRGVPQPISLCRRPFLALGLLGNESLRCKVEVIA